MTIQQSIDACKRCDDGGDGDGDARVVVGGKRDRCKSWRMEERLEVDGQGSCTARGDRRQAAPGDGEEISDLLHARLWGEPLAGAKGVIEWVIRSESHFRLPACESCVALST